MRAERERKNETVGGRGKRGDTTGNEVQRVKNSHETSRGKRIKEKRG